MVTDVNSQIARFLPYLRLLAYHMRMLPMLRTKYIIDYLNKNYEGIVHVAWGAFASDIFLKRVIIFK